MAAATARAVAKDLLGMSARALKSIVVDECGQPSYRATQIREHLYGARRCRRIEDFSLIPREMRDALVAGGYRTGRLAVESASVSGCGTGKVSLRVGEREVIEAVGIPDASCWRASAEAEVEVENASEVFKSVQGWDKNRLTACVSSQVGCAMKCTFCATGMQGYKRNLTPAEITAQVIELEELYGKRVSQVVFMGMGEPMLNIKSVVQAIRCLNEDVGIGGRHITVSTVGIPNSLKKLAKEKLAITLAISLHAPDQHTRAKIVPSAKYYPMEDLLNDARAYFKETGRRVTFEYTLLAGVNDSPSQAKALSRMLKRKFGTGAHVNIIPWNNIDGINHTRPSGNAIHRFCAQLEGGVTHTIRRTRGLDTNAACGMLTGAFERRTLRANA